MKKRRLLIIASLATFVVLGAVIQLTNDTEAHRGTIYVDDNAPSDWYDATHVKTIQEGVDNASVGDNIYVWAGTYTENVDIGKTVTLIGNGTFDTIVKSNSSWDVVYDVTADSVNISGFSIKDANNAAGINLDSVKYCNISNNDPSDNDEGIHLYNSCNNKIMFNAVSYNHPGSGISLHASNNNIIFDNDVSYNAYGIYLSNSSNNTITGNTAIDNYQGNGIYLFNSSNNTITGNTAHDNYWGINLYNSSNNIITNNNIIDNYIFGISLSDSSSNNITHNNASHNFNIGIHLSFSNNNIITSNNASHNSAYGIYLYNSSNNNIYNNYFSNIKNAYDQGTNIWNISKIYGQNINGGSYLGGNYWNDYTGEDNDNDGIGDIPYNIPGGSNQDQYPLMPLKVSVLFQGWNLITVSFNNSWTAEDLGQNITECTLILKFDATTQEFMTHVVGVPYDDFPIVDGVGYFVRVSGDTIFSCGGLLIPNVNVTLYGGWNTLGWFHGYPTTAQSLGENTSASLVLLFNATIQNFMTYVVNSGYDNFSITRGMAVFIRTITSGWWQGEG